MEHQWRPVQMPPQQFTATCPTCSISHFPFCPPPPYPPNPSFPPPPDHPRPAQYHPVPPNFCVFRPPPPPFPPPYDYGSNGYTEAEADRMYKRPRLGAFGDENSRAPVRVSLEDERRLKLIRDHGGGSDFKAPPFDSNNNNNSNMYSPFQPNNNEFSDSIMPGSGSRFSHSNSWQDHYHYQQDHQHLQPYGSIDYPAPGWLIEGDRKLHYGGQPQPPLPVTPPPPLPMEPPPLPASSPPKGSSFTLFPVASISSSVSFNSVSEEWQPLSRHYLGEGHNFLQKQLSPDKPIVIDASQLLKQPNRATRPDHFVIILRGLPGSGKSYLAKMMRDLEVENGGDAPRIHSMDDYFMTEVEKVDESDGAKSYGTARSKKPTVKKVMEYCYEAEMEEAYRDSMLKAFKKTLEEGNFTFVIVDDRNLRVADFAQFWAIAKRSGYEVYILEAAYKDPAGCAARNVHGFTLDEIQKMAEQWEEAPSLYLQLDVKSLFRGDDLKESGIQEVDMDTEDGDLDSDPSGLPLPDTMPEKTLAPSEDDAPHAASKGGKKWDDEEDHATGGKELAKSKWSEDLYDYNAEGSESVKGNVNALSGLIHVYGRQGKSVHWSDQVGNTGFSIGAKKANMLSLVIGPGAGYSLESNPLLEGERAASSQSSGKSRRQRIFQEQLRAERESFKAVFDKRRQRIGVLDFDKES